jgi:RNA polymerase sigma-70 factor (ECF subfamily)
MPNTDQMNSGLATEQDSQDQISLESFTQYRSLLFSLAYRMLGSVADAEDMLQDAFVRWRAASHADIRSPKAFLRIRSTRVVFQH